MIKMKAEYINPFLEATLQLFRQTFGIEPIPGKAFLMEKSNTHRWDVSGVMVLTGPVIGVVVIRLTRYLTEKLLEKTGITCKDDEEREEVINGMIGELVNVIAGNASGKLTEYNIKVSVPFVVQGENHSVMWPERAPIVGIPFSTNYGPFLVNVSFIEPKKK